MSSLGDVVGSVATIVLVAVNFKFTSIQPFYRSCLGRHRAADRLGGDILPQLGPTTCGGQ